MVSVQPGLRLVCKRGDEAQRAILLQPLHHCAGTGHNLRFYEDNMRSEQGGEERRAARNPFALGRPAKFALWG